MATNTQLSLRRLRQNALTREIVQECRVSVEQMIQPVFVVQGLKSREPIPGLTGTFRETPESLLETMENDRQAGVKKFLLFGVPQEKKEKEFSVDFTATQIAAIRKNFGQEVFLATDVCLCSLTSHGHCGVLTVEGTHIDNGATVADLAQAALVYAQAGADCVAPSDMMDGRVGAIRDSLYRSHLDRTLILSYHENPTCKFAILDVAMPLRFF